MFSCTEPALGRPFLRRGESGQIQNRSEIAEKISGKKKIRLVTPLGERACRYPIVLAKGIACREAESGGAWPETVVAWGDIQAIKVRRSGVGLGALLGFLTGAALGYHMTRSILHFPEGSDYFRSMSILGGGLIGALASGWKTVYTAQAGPGPSPTVSLVPSRRGGRISLSMSF